MVLHSAPIRLIGARGRSAPGFPHATLAMRKLDYEEFVDAVKSGRLEAHEGI